MPGSKKSVLGIGAAIVIVCIVGILCVYMLPDKGSSEGQISDDAEEREDMALSDAVEGSGDAASGGVGEAAEERDETALADMVIWEDADLDRDGEAEVIRVREVIRGEVYELEVEKRDGTVLWSAEAGVPHTGWNTVLLYQDNGEDTLIEYRPTMYQGIGSYTLRQFSLEDGKESEINEWSAEFELPLRMNSKLRAFAERGNEFLKNGTVLLSTEQGELVVGPKAAVKVPQLYPVRFDPGEVQDGTESNTESKTGLPEETLPLEFLFASGAGAWGTTLTLYPDGHFDGEYRDGEMGSSTTYICRFSGRFGGITQISAYAYSMKLEEMAYEVQAGKEWVEDGMRYIASEAYGLDGGEEFIFYLPDTPAEGLDEDFRSWWPDRYLWECGSISTLGSYGLYNVNTGDGFFTSW